MLSHTWTFCIFLAIVLPVFFLLRKTRLWIGWLMLASYFFYGWWNPYYLSLVFYSTVLDFFLVETPPGFIRGRAPEAHRRACRRSRHARWSCRQTRESPVHLDLTVVASA